MDRWIILRIDICRRYVPSRHKTFKSCQICQFFPEIGRFHHFKPICVYMIFTTWENLRSAHDLVIFFSFLLKWCFLILSVSNCSAICKNARKRIYIVKVDIGWLDGIRGLRCGQLEINGAHRGLSYANKEDWRTINNTFEHSDHWNDQKYCKNAYNQRSWLLELLRSQIGGNCFETCTAVSMQDLILLHLINKWLLL